MAKRLTDEERAARALAERALALLRKLITENNEWACAALVRVYEGQTADEQASGSTREDNGIGFTGFDAPILTSFAERYLQWRATPKEARRYASPFTERQYNCLRRMMGKYARQCMAIDACAKAVYAALEHAEG